MDKKGAELSVNVVIIAILAILVLVIVAFIFTGGASKFTETVRKVINPVPKGNDLSFAVSECNTRCALAKSGGDDSRFCDYTVKNVDHDRDEKTPTKDLTCGGDPEDEDVVKGVNCDISCQ